MTTPDEETTIICVDLQREGSFSCPFTKALMATVRKRGCRLTSKPDSLFFILTSLFWSFFFTFQTWYLTAGKNKSYHLLSIKIITSIHSLLYDHMHIFLSILFELSFFSLFLYVPPSFFLPFFSVSLSVHLSLSIYCSLSVCLSFSLSVCPSASLTSLFLSLSLSTSLCPSLSPMFSKQHRCIIYLLYQWQIYLMCWSTTYWRGFQFLLCTSLKLRICLISVSRLIFFKTHSCLYACSK